MELPNFLRAIIEWVRAGYPDGVPPTAYVPLFAVLGSKLTEEECSSIADELALTDDAGSMEAIRQAISHTTREEPKEVEIAEVRAHLAAGGWPLAHLARDKEQLCGTPRGPSVPVTTALPCRRE